MKTQTKLKIHPTMMSYERFVNDKLIITHVFLGKLSLKYLWSTYFFQLFRKLKLKTTLVDNTTNLSKYFLKKKDNTKKISTEFKKIFSRIYFIRLGHLFLQNIRPCYGTVDELLFRKYGFY